jgi:hypothetical protein
VPCYLGGHRSGDSCPLHIPDRRPSKVVAQHARTAGLMTGCLPCLVEILKPCAAMTTAHL